MNFHRVSNESFRSGDQLRGNCARRKPVGGRRRQVNVSVDPINDTRDSVRAFTQDHRLGTNWHYLIGDRTRLEIVWALYGIGAFGNATSTVSHNDAIYLIDTRGHERVLVHASTAQEDLNTDLRLLVREASQ